MTWFGAFPISFIPGIMLCTRKVKERSRAARVREVSWRGIGLRSPPIAFVRCIASCSNAEVSSKACKVRFDGGESEARFGIIDMLRLIWGGGLCKVKFPSCCVETGRTRGLITGCTVVRLGVAMVVVAG